MPPKKLRSSSCSTGWCKNHVFQLNPLSNHLYYRKNFKIRLCPRLKKQTTQFQSVMPLFNTDKKYYTPSFYLQEEKKYYVDNDERVMRNHKLKIEQDSKSNEEILVPRQARKRNYCFVCKNDYVDYLDHVGQEAHKRFLRNNRFTPYILQTENMFAKQIEKQKQAAKDQDLKREAPIQETASMSIQQSPKCFDFIRKLVKPSEVLELEVHNEVIQQN